MKTLTPESELDPKSEASMWLISLQRQLRSYEGKAAHSYKARERAYHATQAATCREQIAAHKARHGIA